MPSWYPNKKYASGSFFKEQAAFLNTHGFEVKVLMAEELHTKSYVFQKLKRVFQGKHNSLSTDFLIQKPEAYSFPVIIQKSWSDEKKLNEMDKAYLTAFKRLIKKLHWFPDIIHIQSMYKYGVSSYLIAEVYNIPLVVIEHSPFKLKRYKKVYQERIKKIFEISRKIAGVSHFHKACLSMVNTNKDVEVVWNLMDERMFSYPTYLKSDDLFIITTILRASSVKDPITFFDAILKFMELYDRARPLEVHVVGLSSLDELTKMKDIDENFISKYEKLHHILKFHSWLDRDNIKKLHQKSSVFVSTSIDEPYGVAVREAMLCGLPVISTRSGGPEDTITEDVGVLVEIGDVESIAMNLQAIYDRTLHFNAKQLRNRVISQSGRNAFLKRMEEFYDT